MIGSPRSETVSLSEASPEQTAVLVRDVFKSFPVSLNITDWIRYRGAVPRRTVLHDISLSVRTGELFGLLGANGAGKTTLLKMLATLCIADRGEILVSGIDAQKRPMAVKQRIGLCTSEERSFYYRLTARKNLRYFGALAGLIGDALEARIEEVVSLVDLTDALDRRFDSFSSGMRQRLALARALLGDPGIIFFDEPTRAVDPLHAREIRALIRDELITRQGKTGVLATNSLEEAWAICDTVAILHEGRIVTRGAPRDLDRRFTPFVRYHIAIDGTSVDLIGALQALGGVLRVTSSETLDGFGLSVELDPSGSSVSELFNTLAASGVIVKSFRSEDPQPLDVFIGFTTNEPEN
jgi:ABC-2 type transport system ATP-binding protein